MGAHVVLGMHRSGTSLLTSLLEITGCNLGPEDERGSFNAANPKGFHENHQVLQLNDAALAAAGASWFNVLPTDGRGLDRIDQGEFDWRASQALGWTTSERPWAIKDPRMVPLFPLWRSFLGEPSVVMPVRDPMEVAHSLHVRDGMSLRKAAALWEYYVVTALERSRGLRRHVVVHERLLADPVGETRALLDRLDSPLLAMPKQQEILDVVDSRLHRSRRVEIRDAPFLSEAQERLYEIVSTAADVDRLPTLGVSTEARELLETFVGPAPKPMKPTRRDSSRRRTAVVVQGCRLPVFEPSLLTIRDTWASVQHADVDVFFAYGNGCDDHDLSPLRLSSGQAVPRIPDGEVVRDGDLLLVGASDLIDHQSDSLLRKRLLSLRHLLDTDTHDAFLLVCASSYIDQGALAAHVAELDLTLRFQGPSFVAENGRALVSGSAMMFSRDLAERLVDDSAVILSESSYRYADDISIADWVASRISDTEPSVIAENLLAGRPATSDNTFRFPPVHMLNYLELDPNEHLKVDGAYHYHFATDEPATMRRFHELWFSREPELAPLDRTIFVQIASYRDRDLPQTIISALERADAPERLRFGICWQYDEDTFDDLRPWEGDDRFRIDEVYHRKSGGCTWARSRANEMFEGEDYYLQIDAHMRFADGWDSTLIEMLEGIDSPRPIVSVYPPGYGTDGKGNDELAAQENLHVLSLASINEDLQTRQSTRIAEDQDRPGKSPFLAAGFLFTHGSFCEDVPYDPFGYFAGEEIALAARAYSWGYDFFHPSQVVVWHRYDHDEPLHWEDNADAMAVSEERSKQRLATLLLGDHRELGEYGLGPFRSVKSFERYCGVDFAAAARGELLIEPTSMDFVIDIDNEGIDTELDYEVWVFAILDSEGVELLRSDIDDEAVLSGESTRVAVTGTFTVKPAQYLLWPKLSSGEFGDRRVREIATVPRVSVS